MYIDSHCHLDDPHLQARLPDILDNMRRHQVSHALCVCTSLPGFAQVSALAQTYPHLYASVGVHPDQPASAVTSVEILVENANMPKVIAIGETGLDYFRCENEKPDWQALRFRHHIRAALATQKPLIVHTRSASKDTLRILQEENAAQVGGVMHCFTESLAVAHAALDLGFYISFSGIITFKNAKEIQEVVRNIPLERILIETDAPYLAPVPHRGKRNEPAWVSLVAACVADLKGVSPACVGEKTTENFFRLFGKKLQFPE